MFTSPRGFGSTVKETNLNWKWPITARFLHISRVRRKIEPLQNNEWFLFSSEENATEENQQTNKK